METTLNPEEEIDLDLYYPRLACIIFVTAYEQVKEAREAACDLFENVTRQLIDETPKLSQELCLNRKEGGCSAHFPITFDVSVAKKNQEISTDVVDGLMLCLKQTAHLCNLDFFENDVKEIVWERWQKHLYEDGKPLLPALSQNVLIELSDYIRACIRLTWRMVTQMPPLQLEYKSIKFDKDIHKLTRSQCNTEYSHSEDQPCGEVHNENIACYMWPALLEGGAKETPSTDLQKSYIAVVAIDFGTSYTGFAFSFNKGQEKDAIFMNKDWTNEQGSRTSKAPTCLLLTPELTFNSFGYDAMENYAQLESERKEQEYFFFQHFKMALHSNKTLNLETSVQAANGKRIKAKTVFAHSIKFMKDEAIKLISDETGDQHFKAEDIQWVLTVPAIWTPGAKQFMREAAYEAGVGSMTDPGQLIIALEPETAALFCMERKMNHLEIERGSDAVEDAELSKPQTQYMVVDIGGGTLDVAVHEINDDGSIKRSTRSLGVPMVESNVNREFESLLKRVVLEPKI
ncbi:hypothetical protein OS493_032615 [Desmophyllum pertusum]|uniref:Mitochondria-eating protein C-terminal domain-containing protein n=1 Tax=Desmophyllum pertusum TaxID=174260 RepID=A0A9W9YJA2_9CNID|nr:hypothetical protein OS493_032615 [Desmophyllum pertusum]